MRTQTEAIITAQAKDSGGRLNRVRLAERPWLSAVTTPLLVLTVLVIWETYVRATGVSRFVLPAPSDIGLAFLGQITSPYVWQEHILTTFLGVVWGLFFAIAVGVPLGIATGKSRLFDRVTRPFIVATQVIPKVALIPLFILWFGFGPEPKILIAALLAFFPIMINTAFGVRSVPSSMHDLMTTLKAPWWFRLLKVELPHTLAYFLTGLELAVVQATIGVIVAEFMGGNGGLGRYAVNLQMQLDTEKLFGAIFLMTIFGFVLYSIVLALRKFLVPWHESSTSRKARG